MAEVSRWRAVIGQWNNRCSTYRVSTNTVKSSSNVSDSMGRGAGPTVSVIILVLAGLLVMLSGDVELNPGPVPDVTFEVVHNLLVSQASKWNEIGLALKVPFDFRRGLEQDIGRSNTIKLEVVIAMWIESHCSEVSWDHLITVLQGEQLQMVAVAKTVEDYVQGIEELPNTKRFKPSTSLESSHHPMVSLYVPVHHHDSLSSSTQPSSHQMENYRYGHSLSGFSSLPTGSCIPTAHAHTSEPPYYPQSWQPYVPPTQVINKRFKPSTSPESSHHPTAPSLQVHEARSYIPPSPYQMENYDSGHSLSGLASLPTGYKPTAHAYTSEPPSIPNHPPQLLPCVPPTQVNTKCFKPSTMAYPELSHHPTVSLQLHHEASSSTQPSPHSMETSYQSGRLSGGFTSLPMSHWNTWSPCVPTAHAHTSGLPFITSHPQSSPCVPPIQANTNHFKPSTSPESSHHPTVSLPVRHEASSYIQPGPHQMENYRYDHSLSEFTSLPPMRSCIPIAHEHTSSQLPFIPNHSQSSHSVPPTQANTNPEHCYKQTLVGLYTRKSPSYSKKPSPFLKYINLLLVQPKKGESTTDKKASMRHKMIGDTNILKEESSKKRSIGINDICTTDDNESCPCLVLIKGDPGVGKTTLAWELCVRWAEGSLLQQWKIVKFIQLRAKEVRKAKTVESLLDPYNEYPEFCKYMNTSQGEGMLLIFDGFDELSHEQLNESSIFMRFLEGKTLSKASIIVTSRPSAVQLIPEMFMNNLDQFVEVVGFEKKDIKQYIECKFEDDKDVLKAFNDYITSHEFIFTLMYVPLHCALVTELYEEYQREKMEFEPKTLTQLYTCFIHCLIQRNTGLRVHDINELPHDLKGKFKELARIAAEGIKKQEYVFDIGINDEFGMLQRVDTSSKCGTVQSVSCSFLHLTLQEYLAAYHWSNAPPLEVAGLFKANGALPIEKYFQQTGRKSRSFHWPAVHFYSGLTGVMKTPLEEEITKHHMHVVDSARRNSKEFNFFYLLFESQSITLVSLVLPQDSAMTSKITSGIEGYVIGYCIARAPESVKWEITMKKSGFIKNMVDGIKHAELENYKGSFIHGLEVLEESGDCYVFQYFDYIEQISAFIVKDFCLIYKSKLKTDREIADNCNWSFNLMKFRYERESWPPYSLKLQQCLLSIFTCFKTLKMAATLMAPSFDDKGNVCISTNYDKPINISSYSGFIPYAVVRTTTMKGTLGFGFGFLNRGYELWDDLMRDSDDWHQSSILEYIFESVYSRIMTINSNYHEICHSKKSGIILLDINHQYLLNEVFAIYFYNTESKKWSDLRINTRAHEGHGIMMVVNEGNVDLLINILTKVGAELHPLMLIGDSSELTQVAQSLEDLNIKKEHVKTINIAIIDSKYSSSSTMCLSKSPQYDTIQFLKRIVSLDYLDKHLLKESECCLLCSKLISLSITIDKNPQLSYIIERLFGSMTALKELKITIKDSVIKLAHFDKFGEVFCDIIKNNPIEVVEVVAYYSIYRYDDEIKLLYEGLVNLTTLKVLLIVECQRVFDELLKVISYLAAESKSPTHSVVFDCCNFDSTQCQKLLDIASSAENMKNVYIREDETSTIKAIKEMTLNVNNCRVLLACKYKSANETSSKIMIDHISEGSFQVTIIGSDEFDKCVESLKICS